MSVHVSKQGVRHNTGGLDARTKYVQACFSFFPLPHLSFYSPQPITSYYMRSNTWVWPVISQHLCCGRLYVPWDLCFRVCMCVFFTSFYAFPLCFSFLILWTFFLRGGGLFLLTVSESGSSPPCRDGRPPGGTWSPPLSWRPSGGWRPAGTGWSDRSLPQKTLNH